jgi:hypothetical protein
MCSCTATPPSWSLSTVTRVCGAGGGRGRAGYRRRQPEQQPCRLPRPGDVAGWPCCCWQPLSPVSPEAGHRGPGAVHLLHPPRDRAAPGRRESGLLDRRAAQRSRCAPRSLIILGNTAGAVRGHQRRVPGRRLPAERHVAVRSVRGRQRILLLHGREYCARSWPRTCCTDPPCRTPPHIITHR